MHTCVCVCVCVIVRIFSTKDHIILYSEEIRIEKDIYSPTVHSLFAITGTWKQPRCPSADEWIGNLWYMCTVEYYLPINRNTLESLLMRWMNLGPIIQIEVSLKEKDKDRILMLIYGI